MSDDGELDLNSLNDEELVQQVHDDLYDGLKEEVEAAVHILLGRGWAPYKVLTEALVEGMRAAARFIRAEFRELTAVFLVVVGLVAAATLASALAWSGVGLIAFVPLVGLAVFPLQLAALLLRGFVFEYLGLTALGAYLTLYQGYAARRRETVQARVSAAVQHPA